MAGVTKKKRFDVFKRDGFRCQYCGRTPPQVVLEVDHVVPRSKKGTNDLTNLVTSCFDCYHGKAAGSLDTIPESVLEQAERQRELIAQTRAYHRQVEAMRKQEDATIELLGRYWCDQLTKEKGRYTWGDGRRRSGRTFLKRLPLEEIYEAIDIAVTRRPPRSLSQDEQAWRYFCGICWKKIREAEGG